MESSSTDEREVRAARNQSLFRAVNERIQDLNEAFASINETFPIACECADTACVAMIDVEPSNYEGVRGEPRQFIVLADHVIPDVEFVVRETEAYVVVEKIGTAGEVADDLADELADTAQAEASAG